MNIQNIAQTIVSESGVKYRDDNKPYTVIEYDNHDWLMDFVMACHGDFLPDDYRYQWIVDVAEYIVDNSVEETDRLNIPELIDSLVDVYTFNLTAWLHSNNSRMYYLTEALENYDISDGFQLLQMAMAFEVEEVISSFISQANELELEVA